MTSVREKWRIAFIVALGVVLAAVIAVLILGTEIRIERRLEVMGPDEPVYYMIVRGESLVTIERELQKNPQLIDDSFVLNKTLLAHAVGKGRGDVVRLLLAMGADPNGKGRPGEYTPLITAVSREQGTMVRILIEHGADPDLSGVGFGASPRELAEFMGNQRILSILAGDDNENGGGDSASPPSVPN